MKISYNWLKDYLTFEETPQKLGEILTEIGLEVEGLEKVESIPGGLEGIVTGEVRSVEPHPNADRLQKTTVDVGQPDLLHIVCGATNVAVGQKVLVARPGTILHPTEGKSFEIRKSKIRGEVSEGMICAEDEVGLGTGHDGIMVLDENTEIGQAAAEIFEVTTDFVYEIGLTPNRSDATSHLGVARDLAAALTYRHNKPYVVKIPNVRSFHVDEIKHEIGVTVEEGDRCPRYSSLTVSGLKLGPSPKWMADRLKAIDVRPINNVVDITNFILHELGQPLHAFDLRALKGSHVYVKRLTKGTVFTTLDEVERKLSDEDLMICNASQEPMCIAGVFGGAHSGVTSDTKAIFLESAHFNATSVRKSSVLHNLRTEAARVFEKGSDPSITTYALKRAAMLFKEYAGGVITSSVSDELAREVVPRKVMIRLPYLYKLVGVQIPEEKILQILEAMNMDVVSRTVDKIEVSIPTAKVDVTREADVIEEILRIYGFDNIPIDNKLEIALDSGQRNLELIYQDKISSLLVGMGLNEAMALSFTLPQFLPAGEEHSYVRINNTSNKELEIMRPDLLSSALATVGYNEKRQNQSLRFFEFGRSYSFQDASFLEQQHLAITLAGDGGIGNWLMPGHPGGFYQLKSIVERILGSLNIDRYQESDLVSEEFQYGIRIHRGEEDLVRYGAVNMKHYPNADIRSTVYFADINWVCILGMASGTEKIKPISKYPTVERDLALIVNRSVKFSEIRKEIEKVASPLVRDVALFDVFEDEEYLGEGKRSYGVKILFSDPDKTLIDKEVDHKVSEILENLLEKWDIYLR